MCTISPLVPELLLPVHTFLQLFRRTGKGRAQGKETSARPTHKAGQAPRERHSHEVRKGAGLASRLASVMGSQVCVELSGGFEVATARATGCRNLVTRVRAKSCRGAPLGVPIRQHGIGNPQGTSRGVIASGAPSHRLTGATYSLAGADSSGTWERTRGVCPKTAAFPMHAMQECLLYDANSYRWARGPGPAVRLEEGRSCDGIGIELRASS